MQWSNRYSTGVATLDQQHRMLFTMSRDYREALVEGHGERTYGLMLDSLDRYVRAHFGMEESCMHRYACPIGDANSQAHAQFIEGLTAFKTRFAVDGYSPADAINLVDYLDDWLRNHIARIDTQLKPCVERTKLP